MGGSVVAVLLLCNLIAFLGGDDLRQEDAAYRQPPQWMFLQRLLYQTPPSVEPYRENALLEPFSAVGNTATQNPEALPLPAFTITSTPRFTAVAGRPYRYHVRGEDTQDDQRFSLLTAPEGMTITASGLIEWTPTRTHAGGRGHAVDVALVGPDGYGTRQPYTLIVSEEPHPLGTDEAGRDLGAALLLGTQWTVFPGFVAVAVSLLLGLLLGGLAGYYEGRTEALLNYLVRLSETVPALLLLFLSAVIFRYQIYPVMAVLGLILFPGVARGIKTQVLTLKAMQFIEASRELGLSDAEILWKDILWHNARPFLLTRVFYGLALAVVAEVTLSYLNIGILPPAVSWGTMLLEGRGLIGNNQYWMAFFPALATLLAATGYFLLGSGLEQRHQATHT